MRSLKSLALAQVGQRLQFTYYGGTDVCGIFLSNALRIVDVEEVGDDRIFGQDVDKGEPRQYMFDKAAMVQVVTEAVVQAPVVAAEAACDAPEPAADTRVRRTVLSFVDARQRLHDQIDELNAEDLAEVLAEVDSEDRFTFDADNGQVVLERDVFVPHAVINDNGPIAGVSSLDWVNEDGERLNTSTLFNDEERVGLFVGAQQVTAEEYITQIAQHLGLTVS
jgi:hypothetical protein